MNVLITGGAGFIGSYLARRLIDVGNTVSCVDNFDNYYDPLVKKKNIASLALKKLFRFYEADICEKEAVEKFFKKIKPDYVCHFAAKVGVRTSTLYPQDYISVNIEGTQNILNLSTVYKVKHLIFASSSSVYGDCTHVPFSEKDRCMPISPYGVSKLAAEYLIQVHHRLYNLHATILRFFTVYGPGGRPDMAAYLFVDNIFKGKPITKFGTGKSKRDYTYIGDIADGTMAALEKNYPLEIFNLGSGHPILLDRFIAIVEKLLGKKAILHKLPKQAGDIAITHANISKAHALLGYRPKTSFEEGLKKFIDWYLNSK